MLKLEYSTRRWDMIEPFVIAGQRYDYIDAVIVTLQDQQGNRGRAETCGVDYLGETSGSICQQIESCRQAIESGINRSELQQTLGAGGARNGLDCALWDLQCQAESRSIWHEVGIDNPKSLATAYTIGLVETEHASELATKYCDYRTLKIKADHTGSIAAIEAVRKARPDARIIIDANQSWTEQLFVEVEPELLHLEVALLEQPLPVGEDDALANYTGQLQLAADESVQTSADLAALKGKYNIVNIKLDKTGGLTEALTLAERAKAMGFGLMVGNMCGSSLAMAPAFVVGQLCDYVDIDGPLLQSEDVVPGLEFSAGSVQPSATGKVWAGI